MIPLGLLGQIYLVSMLVGGIFIGFNLVVGNIGEHGDGDAGGDGAETGGDDLGGSGGQDGGGDGSTTSGDDLGGAGGHSASGGKMWSPAVSRLTIFGGGHGAHGGSRSAHSAPVVSGLTARIGGKILSLLSPMSIAIFLAFFGIVGILCDQYLPWLGFLSLIPAVGVSWGVSNVFKYFVRWLIVHGNVSTEAKVENMVGQIGEITVPIGDGRPGEITYIMGSKRYHAAAKTYQADSAIKKGTRVIITEVKDHLVFVEPLEGSDLEHLLHVDDKIHKGRG